MRHAGMGVFPLKITKAFEDVSKALRWWLPGQDSNLRPAG
jgi:hypothetical protein